MYLEYPGLMLLLVVPALLIVHYIWMELAQRRPHLRVSTSIPWKLTGTPFMAWLRHLPFVLRIAAVVLVNSKSGSMAEYAPNINTKSTGVI